MVIIGRTAWSIVAPTAASPPQVTLLETVSLSNVIIAGTGVTEPNSVPIATVRFVLNRDTSWVIARLNVYPLPSHPPPMEGLPPPPSDGLSEETFVIEPGARLYGGGNITIFFLFRHVLLFLFNTSRHYWRGLHPSNDSYLVIMGPTSFFFYHL